MSRLLERTIEGIMTPTASRTQIPPTTEAGAVRIRVLVADDQRAIRLICRQVISREPQMQVVGEASNGEEAVRSAGELSPDVIVLDLHMPKLSGIDAAKLIREAHPTIAIVGLSAGAHPDLTERMQQAGAFACVDKVSGIDDLPRIIAACGPHTN